MANEINTDTNVQIAQATLNVPPAVVPEGTVPVAGTPVQPVPQGATAPQGNEGTHGLVDPNAPQQQAQVPNPNAPADPNAPVIAAAPDDFDPNAVAPAAGAAAAAGGGGGGGGSADFSPYDPGAMGGGRGALDLLGNLDLTTNPLRGILGVGFGGGDDGVSGRGADQFLGGGGAGYENLMPDANVGNFAIQPLQLNVVFNPLNGSTLTSITLTLPEGVGLSIGNPNAAPVYGTVTLTPAQLAGLFLHPPLYSDADFNVSAVATITDRFGGSHTLAPVSLHVIVDAVAQQPTDVAGTLVDDGSSGHAMDTTVTKEHKFEDGFDKDTYTVTSASDQAKANITLSVAANFEDYQDGSEKHYLLVEKLPGFTASYPTVEINGVTYFQIAVDNSVVAASNGRPTITVEIQTPQITGDTSFSVRTGAMAVETPSDGELRYDNNVAYNFAGGAVNFTVDVINSSLTIESGWASEGNNPDKNMAAGAHTADWVDGQDVSAATTPASGAPIDLSITNAQGSSESIAAVTFTYDGDRGSLVYDLTTFPAGTTIVPGVGTLTITFPAGSNVTSISNLIHFQPASSGPQSYNDDDVKLDYSVTVKNDAGASATFHGSSTIVIDAVADLSTDVNAQINGGASSTITDLAGTVDATHEFKDGWDKDTFKTDYDTTTLNVTVSVSTTFPDTDGSESHYILLEVPTTGGGAWTLDAASLAAANLTDAGTITEGGKTYYKLEVTDPTRGSVSADIVLHTPNISGDFPKTELQVGSLVVENVDPAHDAGREYDTGNNEAIRFDGTVSFTVDVINSTLAIQTGWASEGNDPNKNVAAGAHTADWISGDVSGATAHRRRTHRSEPERCTGQRRIHFRRHLYL